MYVCDRRLNEIGKIEAICISEAKGTAKNQISRAKLVVDFGIEADAHGGKWHRQVSLLDLEKIEAFRKEGADVEFGSFGENLVVSGFDLKQIPVGSRLQCGTIVLEITQIGKECHSHCEIYHRMGKCIMPTEGIFARVLQSGEMAKGDEIILLQEVEDAPLRSAVITLSDRCYSGQRVDKSGFVVKSMLEAEGYLIEEQLLLPDDKEQLEKQLMRLADSRQVDLIVTTGGTGLSPRDITPEATMAVAHRNVPGIGEAIRAYSISITPKGMLSRGCSVLRGKTLIVNLPGSEKAVVEILEYLLPTLEHGVRIARGTADN